MRTACKPGPAVITSDNHRGWARLTRSAAAALRTRITSSISLPIPLQLFRIPAPAAGGPFFVCVSPLLRTSAPAHTVSRRASRRTLVVCSVSARSSRVRFVQ